MKNKRGLFLNLPSEQKVMRRYMCSYNSPTFIFQPIELIALAAIYRESNYGDPELIDAIAENLSRESLVSKIEHIQPDFIVSLSGFECIEDDINAINYFKNQFPEIPFVLFGHYATEFPQEILASSQVDYIIHGEPDLIFKNLLDVMYQHAEIEKIAGISYKDAHKIIHQTGNKRIPNPNLLPMPAFDLLKNQYYSEPFFPKPYGLIQSARGCPYQCEYCVKSYGTKLTGLTPENMILQVEKYIELFEIKSFRFIDDTFTAVPGRVIEFCKLMIEKKYQHIKWSCLTRPDTLNDEMLQWMKKAGCIRIYIGMESGSQEVLDFYNKKIEVESSLSNIQRAKEIGFELMGFFMVGAPIETTDMVDKSIQFAKKAKFNFIAVSKLIVYPGTDMYKTLKNNVDFNILPYKNNFIDRDYEQKAYAFQKRFYKKFYLRPKQIYIIVAKYVRFSFSEVYANIISFVKYLIHDNSSKSRKDYI